MITHEKRSREVIHQFYERYAKNLTQMNIPDEADLVELFVDFTFHPLATDKRWEILENLVFQSAEYTYLFAYEIFHSRLEDGEKTVLSDEKYGPLYRQNVLSSSRF